MNVCKQLWHSATAWQGQAPTLTVRRTNKLLESETDATLST